MPIVLLTWTTSFLMGRNGIKLISKHSPRYTTYKYVNKKILGISVKTHCMIYTSACVIVTTHAFCFPNSVSLFCVVIVT